MSGARKRGHGAIDGTESPSSAAKKRTVGLYPEGKVEVSFVWSCVQAPLCDKRLTPNFHTPLVQAVAKMADANKSCSPVAEAYCVWTENGINMVDMVFRSIFAVKEPLGTLLPHMKLVIDGLSTRIQNADPEALVSPLADRPVRPKGSGLYSNHTDCCSTA